MFGVGFVGVAPGVSMVGASDTHGTRDGSEIAQTSLDFDPTIVAVFAVGHADASR